MTSDTDRARLAPRSLVVDQVKAMLAHLDAVDAELRAQLQRDAVSALAARADVSVRIVPDADVGGSGCSVAGAYITDSTPPILAVAASASHGRRAFTALHEYGHHLQQGVFSLMGRITQQKDGGLVLEDAACDAFAAAVLLPKELVMQHIDERGPTAPAVVSLWRESSASRAAACVRAALQLRTPGHVVLLDQYGHVAFSSSRELPPLRRSSDQSSSAIVMAALASRNHSAQTNADFSYRDGIRGQELYAQAADMDGFVLVVAVTESAPWLKISLPKQDSGPKGKYRICEQPECGHEFQTFNRPCEICGVPICPECDRCNCGGRVKEKLCSTCFSMKPAHLFDPGIESCRDCR